MYLEVAQWIIRCYGIAFGKYKRQIFFNEYQSTGFFSRDVLINILIVFVAIKCSNMGLDGSWRMR